MATASSCPVIATTEDQILECVAMRLRAEIPEYGQANCIVTEEAIPEHDNTTGDVICTVTHGTSSFDQDLWEGGGPRHTIENLLVLVTPMVRLLTDKPGEATQLFGSNERGLLRRYKRMVLSALLSDRGAPWSPTSESGSRLSLQPLRPVSSGAPGRATITSNAYAGVSIGFEAPFAWDLNPKVNVQSDPDAA